MTGAASRQEDDLACDDMEVDDVGGLMSSATNGTPAVEATRNFVRAGSWAPANVAAPQHTRVYSWGRNDFGQCGRPAGESSEVPLLVEALGSRCIVQTCGNLFNSAFVTGDGELLTVGTNESGQLGVKQEVQLGSIVRVQALEALGARTAAVGQNHMLAVTKRKSLLSWGTSEFGQLGQGDGNSTAVIHPHAVQVDERLGNDAEAVAAGMNHSLVMSTTGRVAAFGDNSFEQLGGSSAPMVASPLRITDLWAVGVTQIACGDNHCAILTLDHRVFTWGRGKYGQLGLGDFGTAGKPQHVRGLAPKATQVSCGGDHTVVLDENGRVFSWGRGAWGQTGQGTTDNLCLPTRVEALDEHPIAQVSAGNHHTLALSRSGDVWAWGCGDDGQVGTPFSRAVVSPRRMHRFCASPVLFVVAGGDHSIAVTGDPGVCVRPYQALDIPTPTRLRDLAIRAASEDASPAEVAALRSAIRTAFYCPKNLLAAFGALDSLLSQENVDQIYAALLRAHDASVVSTLATAALAIAQELCVDFDAVLANSARRGLQHLSDRDLANTILVLLSNPLNSSDSPGYNLMRRLSKSVAVLTKEVRNIMVAWYASLPPEQLGGRHVRVTQRLISYLAPTQKTNVEDRSDLMAGLHLLLLQWMGNRQSQQKIKLSDFYNEELSNEAELRHEYDLWMQYKETDKPENKVMVLGSVCQMPFVLTPVAKSLIMQGEAWMMKQQVVQQSSFQALMRGIHPSLVQWLELRIRRGHELEDALSQISGQLDELKKPMRVKFISEGLEEEGVDQGGVRKEFFQITTRTLFNEAYGMFTYLEETHVFWFRGDMDVADVDFALVGILLGLAIYNSVILDVQFPLVVYKKLLGRPVGFKDMLDTFPAVGKSLQQLLDFDGDVESTFALTFEVETESFGEVVKHELKPGGTDIPVSAENRKEYVDLYSEWRLTQAISKPFQAFAEGFHKVAGGPALSLLREEELELLIVGIRHLDFTALERAARYDGGYDPEHRVIRALWETLHELSLENKKRFLAFCTGSDRAPVGGLGNLTLVIQRAGPDSDRLPASHTCFNVLLLPEYSSKEKLQRLLLMAIENAQGFGLQ